MTDSPQLESRESPNAQQHVPDEDHALEYQQVPRQRTIVRHIAYHTNNNDEARGQCVHL